ncbi:MAG: carbon-nitrogen hydrolase family protein [Candidatus Glassbacteria bacterium]|nr:carbon-nitrogen hydrolase family protein [Candidatus Glassbacteria bacterium]
MTRLTGKQESTLTAAPGRTVEAALIHPTLILLALLALPLPGHSHDGKTLLSQDTFDSSGAGWETACQRQEISPEFSVDLNKSMTGRGSLSLYGASNSSARGCWRKVVEGIEGGAFYTFSAAFASTGIRQTHHRVFARLEWRNAQGGKIGNTREYPPQNGITDGEWRFVEHTFQAPESARSVALELFISQAPQGRVWWDNIQLIEVRPPPHRVVQLATVNCRPGGNSSVAETVAEFCAVADKAGAQGADIVCLGEGINLIGVGRPGGGASKYQHVAEPIPGPTTEALSKVAREHGMYIVAALGEREGAVIYNTAVLIGRDGEVKGKYRKVHLPEGEYDQGCSAGDSYPVWETDFGRVGIMICWDSWFVDPARALAAAGAEIILLPIWGGNNTLIAARAIENHVYVASCGYDVESRIYGPWGALLAEATERPGVAMVEVDLNYLPSCPWPWPLSDTRHVLMQASRYDVKIPELER